MLKRVLQKPLLPFGKADVAVSEEANEVISALNKIGISVFPIEKNIKMCGAVASHADCNLLQLDKNTFVCDKDLSQSLVRYLEKRELVNYLTIGQSNKFSDNSVMIIPETIRSPYPGEAIINVKRINTGIVCNKKILSNTIMQYSLDNAIGIYHCNQGYVGCSSVLISDNAIMTDDESVYNTFNQIGFDCLMLSKGQIKLSGFDYGFIGGCCGFINKNLLAFTGKLESHIDSARIKCFLQKYDIKYIELTNDTLVDIGGIVPILEEV